MAAPPGLNHGRYELTVIVMVMATIGYFIARKHELSFVDEVWDAGTELVVKNNGVEERILLAEITKIKYTLLSRPPTVVLSVRNPTRLGSEITFAAQLTLWPFKNPLIADLIRRVDALSDGQSPNQTPNSAATLPPRGEIR